MGRHRTTGGRPLRRLMAETLERRWMLAGNVVESEPNDDMATADVFSGSQILSGSFSTPADSDFFRTSLQHGDSMIIDPRYSDSAAGDRQPFTAFDLLNASGSVVIESTDLFQSIFVAPKSGDYFLRVHAGNRFNLPSTDYAISVTIDPFRGRDEIEPNESVSQATEVAAPTMLRGELDNSADLDVFSVQASAGQTLILDLANDPLDPPGAVPEVSLHNPDGTLVAADTNGLGLVHSVQQSGQYSLTFKTPGSATTPLPYAASLSFYADALVEPEHGDELQDHGSVWHVTEAVTTRASVLEAVGDVDVIALEGRGLETFRFDFRSNSNDHMALAGRRLTLLNGYGQLLAYADQHRFDHQLLPALSTPGRYFLLIEATSELGLGAYAVSGSTIGMFADQRDVPLFFFDFDQQLAEHRGRSFDTAFEDPQNIPFLIGGFEAIYDRHDVDVTTVLPAEGDSYISHGTGGFEGSGHSGNGQRGFRTAEGSSLADSVRGFPTGNIYHEVGHAMSLNHVRDPLQQVTWANFGKGLYPGTAFGFNIGPVATEVIYNHADQADWVLQSGAQHRHEIGDDSAVDLNRLIDEMKYEVDEHPPVEVGRQPHSIVKGDFDGNGFRDLATANSGDGTVSVLFAAPDGSFTQTAQLNVGPDATFADTLVAADFNHDGIDDLAHSRYETVGSVSIFLGSETGQFVDGGSLPAGNRPNSIRSADFNGDGNPDLAVVNYFGASVTLLIGNGDGTFTSGETLATGGRRSNGIEISDVNDDGNVDLLVSDALGAAVTVLLGRGDGTFESGKRFVVPSDSQDVVALNLNNDRFPDVASISRTTGSIDLFLADENGDLSLHESIPGSDGSFMLETGDFNGDGHDDVAVPVRDHSIVEVHLNDGEGRFSRAIQFDPGGLYEAGFLVEDADGDGADDLWIAESEGDSVRLLTSAANDPRNDRAVIHASIDAPQQVDQFLLQAEAGETFLFDIDAAEYQYPLDAGLVLKNEQGVVIAENSQAIDSGSGIASLDPSLMHHFNVSGRYTLEVFGEHQSQGKYRLKVTPQSAFDDAGPRVLRAYPEQDDVIDQTRQLIFWLNDAIDPESMTPQNIRVVGEHSGLRSGQATFDPVNKILIWTADQLLPLDEYTVSLDGLTDPLGNALDGESAGLRFPSISGDGTAGGALRYLFTIDRTDTTAANLDSVDVVETEYDTHVIHLQFNEHLDIPLTHERDAVLTYSGTDQVFGTADDYTVPLDAFYQRDYSHVESPGHLRLMSRGYLKPGSYRLSAELVDESGKPIELDETLTVQPTVTPFGVSVTDANFQPGTAHQLGSLQQIEMRFSHPVDPDTLTTDNFRIRYSLDASFFESDDQFLVESDGAIEWQPQTLTAVFRPAAPLPEGFYLVELDGDATGILDTAGEQLDGEFLDSNVAGSGDWAIYADVASGDGRPGGDYRAFFQIVDRTPGAPDLNRVVRHAPLNESTHADSLQFRLEFSEQVGQVDASDFVVVGGSTALVTNVSSVQSTGEIVFELTVSGGDLPDFDGIVGIDLSETHDIQDVLGNPLSEASPEINEKFFVDNTAPTSGPVVTDGGQHSIVRSVSVTFDSPVTIDEGAFEVQTLDGMGVSITSQIEVLPEGTRATIGFQGPLVDASGSLLDGIYRLAIRDGYVRDAAGNSFDGDFDGTPGGRYVDEFFRLFGDSDGDRDVDGQDYGRFGLSFLKSASEDGYDPRFDSDDDGDVDGQDYGRFGLNFLKRI
ncbi:FG-GAP repeat protein [Stieleria neptunia]|uniref:FG-GAP repeat protein n=1 Tax=Stieleria neptunia TaxID=2527979 RepID=A0A518HUI9_9BACT|nr:VCBS repeat-containing protein [Stieleria neptunia]QDV44463.1 FG-GAP repeat protein [Stieleria neptunia]